MRISTGRMRMLGFGRRLARDERGATLVYVSLALTVFMGFAALVIDGSRLFTLDTEMQSAADALALAGAAELDGAPDAITRANRAMDNLVQNSETFGDSATAITGYEARFLDSLPSDDQDITADYVTAAPAAARFVEVRLLQEAGEGAEDNSRSISVLFATAIGGGDTASAGAVAVAGFTSAVCKFTPLFMCNPYSSPAEFWSKVGTPAERRRIIALKQSNGGEDDPKYGPGNFGFLGSIDDATSFKESLAKVDPGACFEQTGVDTEPGNKVSARTALNTRFDIYQGNFKNPTKFRDNPNYRPAQNVTKGYMPQGGNDCKQEPKPPAMGFPLDSNIGGDTPMGNGDWNGEFNNYWTTNHPSTSNPWGTGDLPSRYDVYRWEIENEIPDNSPTGENGNPMCSASETPDEPDRRILYAAVIDCAAYGDLVKGKATDIPVLSFVKMFMTQPMAKKDECGEDDETVDCNNTLFVEMVDVVQPGIDDEVIHDIVQLYR